MTRKHNNKDHRAARWTILAIIVLLIAALLWLLFRPMAISGETRYVYIDNDDNIDSVIQKLDTISRGTSMRAFRIPAAATRYAGNIHTGRYKLDPSESTFTTFRKMRNGLQEPVRLTVPSVRTLDRLAAELSQQLMADSAEIAHALHSDTICTHLGYDTTTVATMFIPNTYEVYWNISTERLLTKLNFEYRKFWTDERKAKAEAIGLTQTEVSTLASIIDEETANNAEKPMIAGMYLNRLNYRSEEYPDGMPLQADPTVKFALKDFSLHRIYHNMLATDSPYNTYTNTGLPPGPIRIASVAGIDAVLNPVHHDYLYMCAKEDFSGTHNFARTYQEHLRNAARYSRALDERNIKK